MKLGIAYYRDPNPPENLWQQDLADIASAGFTMIGVWIPWRYVNPSEGRWELDKYRRLLDLADQNGLKVRVQLVQESAPDWTVRKQPDTLMVNARGQTAYLHAHSMLQLGGWPGLNASHPAAREWTADYYRQVVGQLKDHPAILTWNVWNEIQVPLRSYDPHTQAAYRLWAEKTYGGLSQYNKAHSTGFESFAEVQIPNETLEEVMLLHAASDLAEFTWTMSVEEGRRRGDLVRSIDPDRPVSMHTNTHTPYHHHRDDWQVAQHADIYGASLYDPDPFFLTMACARQRSIKGPGRWWVPETCAGRMVYYAGHFTFTGQDLVNTALRAMAHGASAFFLWQYRNEIYGQEAPNFGLLNSDGSASDRSEAVRKLAAALRERMPDELEFEPARVGLLTEPLDGVFRSASDRWKSQLWPERNEFEQWLRAVLDAGQSPDILLAQQVAESGIPQDLQVIFAPSLTVLRPGLVKRLSQWVQAGGHFVVGPFTGVYDPAGWTFPKCPGDGLSELCGLEVINRMNGESHSFTGANQKHFSFIDPQSGAESLAGRFVFEQVRAHDGARTLLACNGWPAVLTRQVGLGSATYLASLAGAAQANGSTLLVGWLGKFLREREVLPACDIQGPVWANLAHSKGQRVLFVQNPSETPCEAKIATDTALRDPVEDMKFESLEGFATVPLVGRQMRVLIH